jgi:hypothetical protein
MTTLKYQKNSDQSSTPVIASFQQNMPDGELLQELEFNILDHKDVRKKQKVLSSSNDKFQFIGKSM